jgi:alpha-tubulin suppressor-like RCC1 family protein
MLRKDRDMTNENRTNRMRSHWPLGFVTGLGVCSISGCAGNVVSDGATTDEAEGQSQLRLVISGCIQSNCESAIKTPIENQIFFPPVSFLTGIQQIAAGVDVSYALTSSGRVLRWGRGSSRPAEMTVLPNAIQIAVAGGILRPSYACALLTDGTIQCWDDTVSTPAPTPVGLLGPAQKIALGDASICGLLAPLSFGFLFPTFYGLVECLQRPSMTASIPTSGAQAILSGASHSCAIRAGGSLDCWGGNQFGELGIGTTDSADHGATTVALPGVVSAAFAGAQSRITAAVMTDGSVYTWGVGTFGQFGLGGMASSTTPVLISGYAGAVQMSYGYEYSCAAMADGSVRCSGTLPARSITTTPTPIAGLTGSVTQVSVGDDHACALYSTGRVACWGGNSSGQLGDRTTTDRSTPVLVAGP